MTKKSTVLTMFKMLIVATVEKIVSIKKAGKQMNSNTSSRREMGCSFISNFLVWLNAKTAAINSSKCKANLADSFRRYPRPSTLLKIKKNHVICC